MEENPKEYMEDTVRSVKKDILKECREFVSKHQFKDGFYSYFDRRTIPFFDKDFDYDSFIDSCNFNTIGPIKGHFGNTLSFVWRSYDDYDKLIRFQLREVGNDDFTIMMGKNFKDDHEQIYHFVGNDLDEVKYFPMKCISEDCFTLSCNHNIKTLEINDKKRNVSILEVDFFNKLQYYFVNSKSNNKIYKI